MKANAGGKGREAQVYHRLDTTPKMCNFRVRPWEGHLMRRVFILLALAMLAACTTSKQANTALITKFNGTRADDFFFRFGPPASSYKASDGRTLYVWSEHAQHISTPGTAQTTFAAGTAFTTYQPGADINIQCQVRIVADSGGVIREISVYSDSIGWWQLSRCNEVFGGKKK
jgi:hypothetical protein